MKKMSEPEQFQGRIIFMSMFNGITWGSTDNEQECTISAKMITEMRGADFIFRINIKL